MRCEFFYPFPHPSPPPLSHGDTYLFHVGCRDVVNERNLRLEENYVDLWKEFHGLKTDQPMPEGHKGYTYDLEINTTAKCVSDIVSAIKKTQGYNSRFDRIHLRSNVKLAKIELHAGTPTHIIYDRRKKRAKERIRGRHTTHIWDDGLYEICG